MTKIKLYIPLLFLGLFLAAPTADAQINIWNKVEQKVERRVTQKVNTGIDRGIDKGINKAEKGVTKGAKEVTGSKKNKKDKKDKNKKDKDSGKVGDSGSANGSTRAGQPDDSKNPWAAYDYIPGEKVLFIDDLGKEKNGEFPSKWNLLSGSAENASFQSENVITFSGSHPEVEPNMAKKPYLPTKFTVEFDAYFYVEGNESYTLHLDGMMPIEIRLNRADMGNFNGVTSDNRSQPGWRHVSMSFNTRALKLYLDHHRVLNIPNIPAAPGSFGIAALSPGASYGKPAMIKNVRVAEGAVPLYERLQADGKIVTRGIHFKSGKAVMLPESMGTLNEVAQLLKDHPEVNFSIEGHTDSDGDDAFNKRLSEARAETVKNELVKMGVSGDRLTTVGFGEETPMDKNDTEEGKANNRRVEFVQF